MAGATSGVGVGVGIAASSPLAPEEARASFRLADPELRVELVAAEPLVTSPVAIAWDAHGKLFVAEMNDYPTAPGGGRIRRLTDKDGDGRMDLSTVFAEGLRFPSSVLPWRDGLLVASAPDILYFRDLDGDGRADERQVWFTGFAEGNQQLRVNGLTWNLDNWVYGANGRSDGEIRGARLPEPLSLRRRDFRFRPDTGEVEGLAGPSQFGLGFDAGGRRFLSWNTNPLRHEVIPARYLEGAAALPGIESLQDCLPPNDDQRVFPLAPAPRTFNRESVSRFNALAGLHIYGGHGLGPGYVGNAFVGETLRSLVHRRVLEPSGATFVARRAPAEQDREFLASTDPWFHPVNLATGPDGALYVCDFYRRWVEHPGFVPEKFRTEIDWREGAEHGRLWRVTRGRRESAGSENTARLAFRSERDLVARLGHPNAWQRLTAQRLLVEDHPAGAATAALVRRLEHVLDSREPDVPSPLGRLHALATLEGIGRLHVETLLRRVEDADPDVRVLALEFLETRLRPVGTNAPVLAPSHPAALRAVLRLAEDPVPEVRLRAALAAGALPVADRAFVLATVVRKNVADPWIGNAALVAGAGIPHALAASLRADAGPGWVPFLAQLGRLMGQQPRLGEIADTLDAAGDVGEPARSTFRVAVLAGVAEGLIRSGRGPGLWLVADTNAPVFRETSRVAERLLQDTNEVLSLRVLALGLRIATGTPSELDRLHPYLLPRHPLELQRTAVDRLAAAAGADERRTRRLLAEAPGYAAPIRRRLLALAARALPTAVPLVEAFESGTLAAAELDASARDALLRLPSPALRDRANRLWAARVTEGGDRSALVERYQAALAKPGDPRRGAALFAAQCAVCHRVGGLGGQVGPDLTGIGSRASEVLIGDILDPGRQVAPDHLAYTVATRDGEAHTGLLVSETEAGVTLRQAQVPDRTFPRAVIASLRVESRSLMPEGLESAISVAAMSDLLAFLGDPLPELLPAEAE